MPADPLAPRRVVDLPRYWDLRRLAQGKPDASTCAADLRQALIAEREAQHRVRVPPLWVLALYAAAIWVATWAGCRVWLASDASLATEPLCPECTPCE